MSVELIKKRKLTNSDLYLSGDEFLGNNFLQYSSKVACIEQKEELQQENKDHD